MNSTQSQKQHQRMTQTPIPKLVSSLAIPTTVGMLITVIYNTADTYFVSQINKSASAAVGAVYAIMAIIQALGYGLGMGAGSLISRKLGEKEDETASMYASSACFAAIAAGAVIGGLGLLTMEPFLKLLGCTETMMPHAVSYARYVLMGAPVSCLTFVLNNTLRSEGFSKRAMAGMSLGGILNMVLDPLLIFRLNMGAGGAALATMLSQAISCVVLFVMFFAGSSVVQLRPRLVSRRFRDYRMILTTGLPTICRQSLGSVAAAVLNAQAIGYGGDAAGAAITISNKVYILARQLCMGFGQGFQPVAGYNYGAGCRKRTWQSFTFATKVSTVVCLVYAGLAAAFAEPLMVWFNDDPEVVRMGVEVIVLSCAVMPALAFSTYVNQLYQCLGFKGQATFLASCRQGIFFLPAVLLLPLGLGIFGVQAAQPLADFCTFLISIPFLTAFYKKQIAGRT